MTILVFSSKDPVFISNMADRTHQLRYLRACVRVSTCQMSIRILLVSMRAFAVARMLVFPCDRKAPNLTVHACVCFHR